MQRLKNYLMKFKDAKILDIGTGRGDFISLIDFLYDDYSEIIGVDILDTLIEINRSKFKKNPKVKFIIEDIMKTSLPKASFDIVCLSNTLHHLDNINKTLMQMNNLVKNDGIIIINEMISNGLTYQQESHRLLHHFAAKIDCRLGKIHYPTYTKEELIKILNDNDVGLVLNEYWEMTSDFEQETAEITPYINIVDRLLEQVNGVKEANEFIKEAEAIKSHIEMYGFSSATQVIAILKK